MTDDVRIFEAACLPYSGAFCGPDIVIDASKTIVGNFDSYRYKRLNYLAGDGLVISHLALVPRGLYLATFGGSFYRCRSAHGGHPSLSNGAADLLVAYALR